MASMAAMAVFSTNWQLGVLLLLYIYIYIYIYIMFYGILKSVRRTTVKNESVG